MKKSGDSSDAGTIQDVASIIYYVDIGSDGPYLMRRKI